MESFPWGITIFDPQGKILWTNPSAVKLLGTSMKPGATAEDWFSEFECLDPETGKQLDKESMAGYIALQTGEPQRQRMIFRNKHTDGVLVDLHCVPLIGGEAGRLILFTAFWPLPDEATGKSDMLNLRRQITLLREGRKNTALNELDEQLRSLQKKVLSRR